MELDDYLAILRKRKVAFLVTFFLILGIGVGIAFSLPPVYRSEATILIEKQEIPQDLVATTVTGYVQERIEEIRQRLMTYENLAAIAKQLNLFPELRKTGNVTAVVEAMRKSISVDMVDVKTSGSGRKGQTATVAFTVGFEAGDPRTAQKAANLLAEKYLIENKQARSEQAVEVSQFLEKEANKLRVEIEQLEKKLAEFKQKQADQLPELLQVNMRLFEKTEGQIEATKDRILKIEDQITSLQTELSLTPPYKAVRDESGKLIMSPAERLGALTMEYLQKSVRYAPNHPDMIRLKKEIETLGSQSDQAADVSRMINRLGLLRAKLLEVQQKYTDSHPDVQQLKKSVAELENKLRAVNVQETANPDTLSVPPDNPRYITLKTQLDTAKSNLKQERAKLATYNVKLKVYENRLFKTPVVEREYKSLTRDYGNAKKKYAELKDKLLEARLAVELESGEKGERFVLQGKAYLPTTPDKPNRLGIVLLSGLLAFAGGLGALAIAEFRDKSISGVKDVVNTYGALPIVVVPYIENSRDVKARRIRWLLWAVGIIGTLALFLAMVHYFIMPLDEIIG